MKWKFKKIDIFGRGILILEQLSPCGTQSTIISCSVSVTALATEKEFVECFSV